MTNDYKGCVSWREKTSSEQSGFIYGSQGMFSLKTCVLFTSSKQLRDSFVWWDWELNLSHPSILRYLLWNPYFSCLYAARYIRNPFNELFDKSHHLHFLRYKNERHAKTRRLQNFGKFRGAAFGYLESKSCSEISKLPGVEMYQPASGCLVPASPPKHTAEDTREQNIAMLSNRLDYVRLFELLVTEFGQKMWLNFDIIFTLISQILHISIVHTFWMIHLKSSNKYFFLWCLKFFDCFNLTIICSSICIQRDHRNHIKS